MAGGQTHSDLRHPNSLGEVVGVGGSVVVLSVSDVLHVRGRGWVSKTNPSPKNMQQVEDLCRACLAADV